MEQPVTVKPPTTQPDYYAVLDFEANCSGRNISNHEVIEFPVVFINARTLQPDYTFHQYVRPVKLPVLSQFIRDLTGIEQKTVDAAKPFSEVLKDFVDFCQERGLFAEKSCVFVTCGGWDLRTMMPRQCMLSGVEIPEMFTSWINLKLAFARGVYVPKRGKPLGMAGMLHAAGMEIEGRHHSGIDDVKNICRVLTYMLRAGKMPADVQVSRSDDIDHHPRE
jgi:inhibitor of KinA sporulation pathway (predicted exonuclease)